MRVVSSPHTKIGMYGAYAVQNDMELTADQLNEWYEYSGELIRATEKHFEEVIKELERLRQQTVNYIKELNT